MLQYNLKPHFFCFAEVWFQSQNTGEDRGLNQSFLSLGRGSHLGCMTGYFHLSMGKWFTNSLVVVHVIGQ